MNTSNTRLVAAETTDHSEEQNHDASHSETSTHTEESGAGHGAEESGLAVFGIDPTAIAFQFGVFVVLYLLIRKFALKGIVDTLDSRHKTIEESLENAKQIEKDMTRAGEKQEQMIAQARRESDAIVAKASHDAGVLVKEAEDKTVQKTEKMIADAHTKIESDVASARAALEKDVKNLVAEATEAVLRQKIDSKTDEKLIERAIKEAS